MVFKVSTVKHLISAVSNFRSLMKLIIWRILMICLMIYLAPDSKEKKQQAFVVNV